jgi:hypothetical protein
VQQPNDAQRRKRIRRTALLLLFLVLMFYFGFIAMGVMRSRG